MADLGGFTDWSWVLPGGTRGPAVSGKDTDSNPISYTCTKTLNSVRPETAWFVQGRLSRRIGMRNATLLRLRFIIAAALTRANNIPLPDGLH